MMRGKAFYKARRADNCIADGHRVVRGGESRQIAGKRP
jgi:hypothetical protein